MSDLKKFLEDHFAMLKSADIDGLVADYADDAVMITSLGTSVGKQAVRDSFAAIPADMFADFEVTAEVVEGDTAYITWKTPTIPFGTDSFFFVDGKVKTQTVAFYFG